MKEADSEEEVTSSHTENEGHKSFPTTVQANSPSSTNEVPVSPKTSEDSDKKTTQKDTHVEDTAASSGTSSDGAVPASSSTTSASVESNSSSIPT